MHIKQITMAGFRSFKKQVEIEAFSPQHNVIVGRNGSGKSNYFAAIQFVLLAEKFANLRQEERQRLLHEGAGQNVMSAFVEVVFDNADGRIPVDGDEVVLRRTVGLKKDEFFLNRRRVTKGEVGSLLESAGFSKSNPYYIVQQGKVNELCDMSDAQRLNLLKEVAGTKVYEERRQESNKIIEETNAKREKIQDVISYIEERLEQLEQEKTELQRYQQQDRTRRAIEYTMYDQELRAARQALAELEDRMLDANEENDVLYDEVHAKEDEVREIEAAVSELQETARAKTDAQRPLRAELDTALHDHTVLELEVGEIEERLTARRSEEDTNQELLGDLQAQEVSQRRELETQLEPAYLAAKAEMDQLAARLESAQRKVKALYQKQGRSAQFSSAAERDAALSDQVASLEGELQERHGHLESLRTSVTTLEAEAAEHRTAMAALNAASGNEASSVTELKAQIRDTTIRRNAAAEARKENWRALDTLEEKLRSTRSALEKSERELAHLLPRHVADGLDRVAAIQREEGLRGVLGPVVDNFHLRDDKYRRAVEVAAKAQLFHVIVDTDETAAYLMERLEREKAGRLTFLPLNQLRVRHQEYPESADVRALIEVAIAYDAPVDKAMREVFGKKLLARNMDVASDFAARANLDAITIEGDEVNRRGALFGGYHAQRESAIAAMAEVRRLREEIAQLLGEQQGLQRAASTLEQNVTGLVGELQALEAQFANQQKALADRKQELHARKRDARGAGDAARQKAGLVPQVESEVTSLEDTITALSGEIGTDLHQRLSGAEKLELADLEAVVAETQAALPAATHDFQDAALARERVVANLDHNLARRMAELSGAAADSDAAAQPSLAELESRLSSRQLDLESSGKNLESLQAKLADMDEEVRESAVARAAATRTLERLKAEQAALQEKVEKINRNAQKAISRRQTLLDRREENMRKIQNIGPVPASELGQFQELRGKELLVRLRATQKELKEYNLVNKKAGDQYVTFSEQRESLLERKAELDTGAAGIEGLILTLDQQKDEAVLRTFQGVSRHFREVFGELVKHGSGRLVMATSADDESAASLGSDALESVAQFTGVSVEVSFSAADDNFYPMAELSGGQRALVALALIFAIQRCDPAPFYLFDEIDQALDTAHREAVARLIQKQAGAEENRAQFITTTFHEELAEVADQFYGIRLQNKVSSIIPLTSDETLAFIQASGQDEAVGATTPVREAPRRKRGRQAPAATEENDENVENVSGRGNAEDIAEETFPGPEGSEEESGPGADEDEDEEEDGTEEDSDEEEARRRRARARRQAGRKGRRRA